MTRSWDTLVIGGGPAGSTAANLLAQAGQKVLVIEREVFPRFHIGESLLPCDLALFRRLGVSMDGEPAHLRKNGAEFYDEKRRDYAPYPFADSLDGTAQHAYQVERARFDEMLLDRAADVGAEVHQGEKVVDFALGTDAAEIRTSRDTYRGRYVIDATGMDALFAKRARSRRPIRDFGLAAVFQHYEGLRPEIAAELAENGYVKVLFVDDGWVWAIPLGGARLSVGLVTRAKGIEAAWLEREIAASKELRRLVEGAGPPTSPTIVGAFSFFNTRSHGPRWACVGDAAGFLDPVFSSGVSLAMLGAERLADELAPALAAGREADPELMQGQHRHILRGYNVFATLISALYERRLLPGIFFTKDQDGELRRGLTSLLAGDVWREDNSFQNKLWRSLRRRYDLENLEPLHE